MGASGADGRAVTTIVVGAGIALGATVMALRADTPDRPEAPDRMECSVEAVTPAIQVIGLGHERARDRARDRDRDRHHRRDAEVRVYVNRAPRVSCVGPVEIPRPEHIRIRDVRRSGEVIRLRGNRDDVRVRVRMEASREAMEARREAMAARSAEMERFRAQMQRDRAVEAMQVDMDRVRAEVERARAEVERVRANGNDG